jgi:CxxC-x17-CxxC domain-containing protein
MYQDRQLTCRDCGATFIFTTGEQEFYATKGLVNAPRRCPDCRRAAKQTKSDGGRGSYGGGGGGYGGGGYERAPRQMTDAVCAQCGAPTQVPFQPRGDRPVYCSDCYSQIRGGSYSGSR